MSENLNRDFSKYEAMETEELEENDPGIRFDRAERKIGSLGTAVTCLCFVIPVVIYSVTIRRSYTRFFR